MNTCIHGRYSVEKHILTDPRRDVVLQRIRFLPLGGRLTDYRVYVLLAPHLSNRGWGNTAFVGDYKGVLMLFAGTRRHGARRGVQSRTDSAAPPGSSALQTAGRT